MRLTIIPADKIVIVNGEAIFFDFDIDPDIHAVQWDGEKGNIETLDGGSIPITSIEPYAGIIEAYEAQKIVTLKASPPSNYHAWNDTKNQWELYAAGELEQAKDKKITEIHNEKKRVRDGGVTVNGIVFDTDSMARISYLEFAFKLMANIEYSVPVWRASEGIYIEMDAALHAQIAMATEQLLTDVFSWQAAQEAAVKTATKVEEVEAIASKQESTK